MHRGRDAAVNAATEIETLDADLGAEVPCGEFCSTPASWILNPGCGHHELYCTPHKEQVDAEVSEWVARQQHALCSICHREATYPLPWRLL
jgi:hypothetical protein